MREAGVCSCRGLMVLTPAEFEDIKRWSDSLREADPDRVRVVKASELREAMRAIGRATEDTGWSLQDIANAPLRLDVQHMTKADFDYIASWVSECDRMPVVLGRGRKKRSNPNKRRNRKNKKRK